MKKFSPNNSILTATTLLRLVKDRKCKQLFVPAVGKSNSRFDFQVDIIFVGNGLSKLYELAYNVEGIFVGYILRTRTPNVNTYRRNLLRFLAHTMILMSPV